MSFIRLILLGLIGGGLVLFFLQNQTPVLPLVFLNLRTFPLPLSVWVMGAIAAGILTTLFVNTLIRIAGGAPVSRRRPAPAYRRPSRTAYQAAAAQQAAARRERDPSPDDTWREPEEPVGQEPEEDFSDRPPAHAASSPTEEEPGWEEEDVSDWFDDEPSNRRDDWDDWEEEARPAPPPERARPAPSRTDYEKSQKPKSVSRSGSVYSYSYREPGNSGAGKTESVVDADYRVIVPPHRDLDETSDRDYDDEDDDEFDRR